MRYLGKWIGLSNALVGNVFLLKCKNIYIRVGTNYYEMDAMTMYVIVSYIEMISLCLNCGSTRKYIRSLWVYLYDNAIIVVLNNCSLIMCSVVHE